MDGATKPESATQRLRALVEERFRHGQERRFAERVCRELLVTYEQVHAREPQLAGDALYEAVIAQRATRYAADAHGTMRRVHESIEDWEHDREPNFRDVVKFLIVTEYLAQQTGAAGIDLDLDDFLARRVDEHY